MNEDLEHVLCRMFRRWNNRTKTDPQITRLARNAYDSALADVQSESERLQTWINKRRAKDGQAPLQLMISPGGKRLQGLGQELNGV